MDVPQDRLSQLPNDVIHLIFLKLETRDVVRTTVLSKRWVNLWTTVASLDFRVSNYETYLNFVNRVLERWNGTKINSFRIKIGTFCCGWRSPYGDMGRWVDFAVGRNVEELHILNRLWKRPPPDDPRDSLTGQIDDNYLGYELSCFPPPQSLYSCSSLRELILDGCDVRISSDVCLDQLKSLVVERGQFDEDMISRVLSGSPKLETLRMFHEGRPHHMIIRSSSLKTLVIESFDNDVSDELTISAPKLEELDIYGGGYTKCLVMETLHMFHEGRPHHMIIRSSSLKTLVIKSFDNDVSDELTISAPKLEELEICGGGYTKCLVMDTFSLKNVVLGLEEVLERDDDYEDEEEGGRSELIAETLRQILPAIQYAQTVNLSMDCCKVLSLMPCGVPSFSKVTRLNVASFPIHELEDIAGILETFPKLESLIISSNENHNDNVWKHSRNLEPLLLHLRTIVIVDYYEDSFGFIVSLLKHATEVRKIVIRNMGDCTDESKYKEMVEKELPGLQSSFPKLEQILYRLV